MQHWHLKSPKLEIYLVHRLTLSKRILPHYKMEQCDATQWFNMNHCPLDKSQKTNHTIILYKKLTTHLNESTLKSTHTINILEIPNQNLSHSQAQLTCWSPVPSPMTGWQELQLRAYKMSEILIFPSTQSGPNTFHIKWHHTSPLMLSKKPYKHFSFIYLIMIAVQSQLY